MINSPMAPVPEAGAVALRSAVLKALAEDEALQKLLGGARVYDMRPGGVSLPCITLGAMESRDAGGGADPGRITLMVHYFAVYAFSRAFERMTLDGLLAAVAAALHNRAIRVEGYRLVNLLCRSVQTPDAPLALDRRTWRGVARFRAVTEYAPERGSQERQETIEGERS